MASTIDYQKSELLRSSHTFRFTLIQCFSGDHLGQSELNMEWPLAHGLVRIAKGGNL